MADLADLPPSEFIAHFLGAAKVHPWLLDACEELASINLLSCRAAAAGLLARNFVGYVTDSRAALDALLRGEDDAQRRVRNWTQTLTEREVEILCASITASASGDLMDAFAHVFEAESDEAGLDTWIHACLIRDQIESMAFIVREGAFPDALPVGYFEEGLKVVDLKGLSIASVLQGRFDEDEAPEALWAVGREEPTPWWGVSCDWLSDDECRCVFPACASLI